MAKRIYLIEAALRNLRATNDKMPELISKAHKSHHEAFYCIGYLKSTIVQALESLEQFAEANSEVENSN